MKVRESSASVIRVCPIVLTPGTPGIAGPLFQAEV